MKMNVKSLVLLGLALIGTNMNAAEPVAEKIPTKLKKHNDVRIDNYFWMKDKKNEKVINYLKAENAYREEVLADTKDLQDKLYKEMRTRVKEDDQSVPYKEGDYFYYHKTLAGQEYPIDCRRKLAANSPEEIILDVNELAKGFDSIHVTGINFHPNQQLFGYAVDTKGDRIFTIYFKDMNTGKLLDKKIENVSGDFEWAESGKIIFYGKQDPVTLRTSRIYRYDLETGVSILVYEEKDEKREVGLSKSLSNKYIFINNESTLSSEIEYISADQPLSKFKTFSPREKEHLYHIYDGGDRFFVKTNWKAKNFRVMEVDPKNTAKKNWKEVIPHRKDVLVDGLVVFKDYMVIAERSSGLTQLNVLKRGENKGSYINFPDPAYTVEIGENAEYDSNAIRYEFVSMNRPYSVYDFNFKTLESKLLKVKEVPNYNSADYTSERVFATAHDGTKIPVSIVYKKGLKKDSTAPILVYGYGSYGISSDPYFSSARVSLLDRGFVFAIIHTRGGMEMGRAWYEDGKFFRKKNTFTDFIDATEFLINEKYANPKKVYANGGSAGGLLMGAIMNLRPDLYHGIVADVPFVDVVTTMLDSSLPLTTGEYEEWGNPNNKKYYEYMKSYSPYDNVKPANYPNLLVTTGLNDSQVSFWEPTKWVAKLRDLRTDKSKMLVMKIEMDVGHGGKSGRFEYLHDEALTYAFLIKLAEQK
ncbi:MAG: S9 family peptidase [Rhizobacter sp.]|nr:S9 family peptidase [Bacteriovorax sp.]